MIIMLASFDCGDDAHSVRQTTNRSHTLHYLSGHLLDVKEEMTIIKCIEHRVEGVFYRIGQKLESRSQAALKMGLVSTVCACATYYPESGYYLYYAQ